MTNKTPYLNEDKLIRILTWSVVFLLSIGGYFLKKTMDKIDFVVDKVIDIDKRLAVFEERQKTIIKEQNEQKSSRRIINSTRENDTENQQSSIFYNDFFIKPRRVEELENEEIS